MRKLIKWRWCFCSLIILSLQVNAQNSWSTDKSNADNLPIIPVGLDSYRMWDKWPQQRIGVRAYMRSTYDRQGGNEGADGGHFLFFNEETFNVTLDVKGKGVLYFFRTNYWHGSPWHFVVDGTDNIVQETGTSDPVNAREIIMNPEFIPSAPFPKPLNFTWRTTKGADLIWTPVPFEESMRIAYSRTMRGTGYYIYHLYADEGNLSHSIRTWDINQVPDKDVLDLIDRSGTDIAPVNIKTERGKLKLNKEKLLLADIKTSSASSVRAIKITIPLEKAIDLERVRLQVTWDGADKPSINAPICLFFGAGTFYNRDNKEYLVKAFPVNIRFDYQNQMVELGCYFPMPFYESVRFELTEIKPDNIDLSYEIRYETSMIEANGNTHEQNYGGSIRPLKIKFRTDETMKPDQKLFSYFHATYKDIPRPEPGKDMIFLDTQGEEGFRDWSGNFVGTSFIFSHDAVLNTLEGDPRFFLDDSQTPNYGTGTEEWGGGGGYWGGQTMTLPFAGHPVGSPDYRSGKAKNEKDLIQSAYRFLLADLMPFGKRAVIKFEHGGENLSMEHYEAVTYWYGVPSPALILTDELDIGNVTSEREHKYNSPEASVVQSITSRYEWGINKFPEKNINTIPNYDDLTGEEVYPVHHETGRYTRGISEFRVRLDDNNKGALLRRTLDYSFPNQTAKVFIADASSGQALENAEWEYAGIWYTAGSNTSIYSRPPGELDKRQLNIRISNRRFRDDEFLIPASLTEEFTAIWVRIKFVPDDQELYPGTPFPKESAWSEIRYKVYSYVIPDFFQNRKPSIID